MEAVFKAITTPYELGAIAEDPETETVIKPAVDVVNHPSHYSPNGRDSFMHMKDQMGTAAFDGFLQGNAIKYVQRYAFKGKPTEDLCKAAFYLFHLAFETTDGSKGAVAELLDRMATTLKHAYDHYRTEAK
jgi:hypothetical protein